MPDLRMGEIVATFEWKTDYIDEPFPPYVAVDEGYVAAYGDDGSCDNAFGDPEVNKQRGGTAQNPVHHYRVLPTERGGKVTIRRSPAASAGSMASYYYGFCSVAYRAEVAPIALNVSGGKDDKGKQFLVGQRCVASLSVPSGWTVAPAPPATGSGYAWSVSGADPFKSFSAATTALTSYGHRIDLAAGDKDDPTLTCCFAKAGTATISVTTHLVSPRSFETDISVTKSAQVDIPVVASIVFYDGRVDLVGNTLGVVDGPAPNPPGGFVWDVSVTTPPNYGTSDRGKWGWAQILVENSTRVHVPDGKSQIYEMGSDDPSIGWFTTGIDGGFPAPFSGTVGGYIIADGTTFRASDPPGQPLDSTQASSYNFREEFTDYLMYLPPGEGSQHVPLLSFIWYWAGSASYSSGWSKSNPSQGHGTVNSNPAFPDWSHKALSNPAYIRWKNVN